MPEALHIHRRVISNDHLTVVQQIHYVFTDEGLVDILKMTAHYTLDDDTVSPNFISGELTHVMKMFLLSKLIEDGIIDIP